jgi:hypothetical protein
MEVQTRLNVGVSLFKNISLDSWISEIKMRYRNCPALNCGSDRFAPNHPFHQVLSPSSTKWYYRNRVTIARNH